MSTTDGNVFPTATAQGAVSNSADVSLVMVTQQVQTQMNLRQSNSQWRAEVMLTDSLLEDILIAQYRLHNAKKPQE